MHMSLSRSRAVIGKGLFAALLLAGPLAGPSLGHAVAQDTNPSIEILSPVARTPVTTDAVDVK